MANRSKPKRAPLNATAASQRKQLNKNNIRIQAETLGTKADQSGKGKRRTELVNRIADLNVEFQAEE